MMIPLREERFITIFQAAYNVEVLALGATLADHTV